MYLVIIPFRFNAPGLGSYYLHDPHLIDIPENRRLPIDAFDNSF